MNSVRNVEAFLSLVKLGLWPEIEKDNYSLNTEIPDWNEIYKLAEQQSVLGLVSAGIERLSPTERPKQTELFTFMGAVLQIETLNLEMNKFVEALIEKLYINDIYPILVKGQGIAQSYEQPQWRSCGDVDLLLDDEDYKKAKEYLLPFASSADEEDSSRLHIALSIKGWMVELHGTLRSNLWKRLDVKIDELQRDTFENRKVRVWSNGSTDVYLPAADNDVIFVFCHILQHFFQEGIGLRQICDWCRLLWTYKDKIDESLLKERLRNMGTMSEWKAFASFAVEYLGVPSNDMPLYSNKKRWNKKAKQIMKFVLRTGSFGHNRDYSYYESYPFVVYKIISLWRHTVDFFRYFRIFPLDAIKVWWNMLFRGMRVAFND